MKDRPRAAGRDGRPRCGSRPPCDRAGGADGLPWAGTAFRGLRGVRPVDDSQPRGRVQMSALGLLPPLFPTRAKVGWTAAGRTGLRSFFRRTVGDPFRSDAGSQRDWIRTMCQSVELTKGIAGASGAAKATFKSANELHRGRERRGSTRSSRRREVPLPGRSVAGVGAILIRFTGFVECRLSLPRGSRGRRAGPSGARGQRRREPRGAPASHERCA